MDGRWRRRFFLSMQTRLKMTHVYRSLTDKAFTPTDNTKSVSRYCVAFMVITTCVASVDVGDTLVM